MNPHSRENPRCPRLRRDGARIRGAGRDGHRAGRARCWTSNADSTRRTARSASRTGASSPITPCADSRSGGRFIDWSAYTVLPGLIDLHTHLVGDISSADVACAALELGGARRADGRRACARDARGGIHHRARRRHLSRASWTSRSGTRSTPARSRGRACSSPAPTSPFTGGGGEVTGLPEALTVAGRDAPRRRGQRGRSAPARARTHRGRRRLHQGHRDRAPC